MTDAPRPLRAAWKVAVLALVATITVGIAVGFGAAVASGSIHRDASTAGEEFCTAFAPFIAIVTVAAYVIQRRRIAQR